MTNKNVIKCRRALFFVSITLIAITVLAGCSKKEVDMNELGANGMYNYHNDDLGFAIELPQEFIYYQTQRKTAGDHTDLEFYVPTADTNYIDAEFPSYGKPVVVGIFTRSDWDKADRKDNSVQKVGEKNGRIYTLSFWKSIPSDWKAKWNQAMQDEITKSFKTR